MDYKEKVIALLKSQELSKEQKEKLESIFPELKESEDGRIRKALISFLKSPFVNENITDEKVTPWIAWLEKQGKQKPVQETEPTPIFKIGDILKRKGKDYTFRVDRIQGGYYHCDRNYGAFFPIEEQGNWELVEQNPTWSEEDKRLCQCLIEDQEEALDNVNNDKYGHSEIISDLKEMYNERISWLKSLKGRVQPQPIQEWSEEDIVAIDCAVEVLSKDLPSLAASIERLKSLRPRSHWKPSDEQLEYLTAAIEESNENPVLDSLYQDLKKLRDE